MCLICGWLYEESAGAPDHGIAPGTPWEQVPMNWTCPECGARKEDFEMVEEALVITDCTQIAEKQVSLLSGGESQRVATARAIAQDTDWLILDEPI